MRRKPFWCCLAPLEPTLNMNRNPRNCFRFCFKMYTENMFTVKIEDGRKAPCKPIVFSNLGEFFKLNWRIFKSKDCRDFFPDKIVKL